MTNEDEKVTNHNKNFDFFFWFWFWLTAEANNSLNYHFKFMDYETVMQWAAYLKTLKSSKDLMQNSNQKIEVHLNLNITFLPNLF